MNLKPKTTLEIGNFKGKPMIVIYDLDDNGVKKPYPFQFGISKAKKILVHLEQIKNFVENNKEEKGE